eukprot:5424334-Prymnesium_polylepis.1
MPLPSQTFTLSALRLLVCRETMFPYAFGRAVGQSERAKQTVAHVSSFFLPQLRLQGFGEIRKVPP